MEYSGFRVTPCEVAPSQTMELDISGIQVLIVAEMPRWGTAIGDVSIALGDMGDFFDPTPGDCLFGFGTVKRLQLRNNTAASKKIVLWLHQDPTFRFFNAPRGV